MSSLIQKPVTKCVPVFIFRMVLEQFLFLFEHGYIAQKNILESTLMAFV